MILGVAGAWLATLGACGRTSPGLDAYSSADDDDDDTTSGRGGGSATGGSSRGGSSPGKGGAGVGGSFVDTGGTAGDSTGAGGSSRGGSSFGGGGGDLSGGGTFGKGGTVAAGGSGADGGTIGVGGFATGGAQAMGGSANAGAGGSNTTGGTSGTSGTSGTGATGGTSTLPVGIRCGEELCEPDASVCCSRRSQPSFCTYPGAECRGATLTCSGPGTCAAGEVCCYHALSSFCTTECAVSAGEPGIPPTIILCDSTADCGPDQTCVLAPRGIAYCGENL